MHSTEFLKTVRSLGVTLNLFKYKVNREWTSLLVGEKRLFLHKLLGSFAQILPPTRVEHTKQLWTVSMMRPYHIVSCTL